MDEYYRCCITCGKETGYLYWSDYCNDCRPKRGGSFHHETEKKDA